MPFGSYIKNDWRARAFQPGGAWTTTLSRPRQDQRAYANSALIKTDAVLAGYDEALVLNNDGHVSEASAANLFIIRKGVAITHH
jgi:branched-subunit amino acid aminotransferase/4-amino-4-deoxychorismate lyase